MQRRSQMWTWSRNTAVFSGSKLIYNEVRQTEEDCSLVRWIKILNPQAAQWLEQTAHVQRLQLSFSSRRFDSQPRPFAARLPQFHQTRMGQHSSPKTPATSQIPWLLRCVQTVVERRGDATQWQSSPCSNLCKMCCSHQSQSEFRFSPHE